MADLKTYVMLSELAKKLGVNKSMLAYYEKRGLLVPSMVIGPKRVKIYNLPETSKRIKKILKLREKDVGIGRIKVYLTGKA
jgi:DNA-binding transcriptional MerR regulator